MIIIINPLINCLLNHAEPAIRYKTRVHFLGEDPSDPDLVNLREQIRFSPIVHRLLSERDPDGRIDHHPYKKWNGSHWILTHLAELEYPLMTIPCSHYATRFTNGFRPIITVNQFSPLMVTLGGVPARNRMPSFHP